MSNINLRKESFLPNNTRRDLHIILKLKKSKMSNQETAPQASNDEYAVLSWSGDKELKERPNGGEPIFEAKLFRGDGVPVRLVMWVFATTFFEYFGYVKTKGNNKQYMYKSNILPLIDVTVSYGTAEMKQSDC
jgi:hypothetical protein